MQFVETSAFTRRVRKLLDMEAYAALQLHLLRNPEAGSVIRGTGGTPEDPVAQSESRKARRSAADLLLAEGPGHDPDALCVRQVRTCRPVERAETDPAAGR